MNFIRKFAYYPIVLLLRLRIAIARGLLQRGEFRWRALHDLGIPGFGVDLIRVDFPPSGDPPPRWGWEGRPAHPELADALARGGGRQVELLEACLGHSEAVRAWPASEDPSQPNLPWRENMFLTLFDEAALYGMLRHLRPERYLEIGCGMSTRVAWQARRDGSLPMEIVSIDPEPRYEISALCDRVHRRRLEEMAPEVPALLTPRTVVFFDGSHRCFPDSDVTVFFLELLPRMPAGVVVHIHDIYLPGDYPPAFMKRLWSEQYLLAAHILGGGRGIEILLPCADLLRRDGPRSLIEKALGSRGIEGVQLLAEEDLMADITLLVPCYNAVRYLPRLLDSVAAQTRPFSAAIFYDDGSADGTAAYLRGRGLRVLDGGGNRGPAFARNRLIEAASGDWIHFHDCDDLLDPGFVERMSSVLGPEVDIAVCDCDWLAETDRRVEVAWRFDGALLARDPVEANLVQPCGMIACVFRLEALRRAGGFDEALPTWEDADLQVRLAASGARFRLLPEVLSIGLRHGTGASSNLAHLSENRVRILERYARTLPSRHLPTIAAESEKLAALLIDQGIEPGVVDRCLALCRSLGWPVPNSRHPLLRAARAVFPAKWLLRVQTRFRHSRPG